MTTPARSLTPADVLSADVLAAVNTLDAGVATQVREALQLAGRRGSALSGLQQLVVALARTLDEDVILDEVARGALRMLGARGVMLLDTSSADGQVVARRRMGDDAMAFALPGGDGGDALAEMWRTGTALLLRREVPHEAVLIDATWPRQPPLASMLLVPMVHGRKLFGALLAWSDVPAALDDETRDVATTLAVMGGSALRNVHLHAESERSRRQSDALAEVARAVGESLRVTEVQRLILRHAMALLGAEGACVALRDGDYVYIESAAGIAEVLTGVVVPVHGSLTGQVVLSGTARISNAVAEESGVYQRNLQLVAVRQVVIVPLRTARGVIGALSLFNRAEPFVDGDARVLQRLADQVSVAIVNARLFADIQDATREWSSTFDAIGVGMAVVNEEGRVLRCNARARQLAGDETTFGLIGRPLHAAILGGVAVPADDPIRRAIDDGARGRARWVHADGRQAFDVTAVPHPDGGAVVTFDAVE